MKEHKKRLPLPLIAVGLSSVIGISGNAFADAETPAVKVAASENAGGKVSKGDKDEVNELDAVVITAEHRATNVQKTPIAVGVIGADELDRNGIKKLWDANGLVAGLNMSSYPSNMQYISIRGIGTSDPGNFAAVGFYLDDVYLGRTFGRGAIDLPDIDRIEVLRGPQGTLYGQNTTGGRSSSFPRTPHWRLLITGQAPQWATLGKLKRVAISAAPSCPELSAQALHTRIARMMAIPKMISGTLMQTGCLLIRPGPSFA